MPAQLFWSIERHSEVTGLVPEGTLLLAGVRARGVKVNASRGVVEED
jgi:hypothetical protein